MFKLSSSHVWTYWYTLFEFSNVVRLCLNLQSELLDIPQHCQVMYEPVAELFIPVLSGHVWTWWITFFFDYSSIVRSCMNLLWEFSIKKIYIWVVSKSCVNLLSRSLVLWGSFVELSLWVLPSVYLTLQQDFYPQRVGFTLFVCFPVGHQYSPQIGLSGITSPVKGSPYPWQINSKK